MAWEGRLTIGPVELSRVPRREGPGFGCRFPCGWFGRCLRVFVGTSAVSVFP